MPLTFKEIDKADLIIIEFSEKGVGLGIEAATHMQKTSKLFSWQRKGQTFQQQTREYQQKS